MELFNQMYSAIGENGVLNYTEKTEIVKDRCYQALEEIRAILADESIDDEGCFYRIEEIVRVFEKIGSNGGGRHDFG